jgi:hypothetical protein
VLPSADRRHVYVAGSGEDAIGVFRVTGPPLLAGGASCDDAAQCFTGTCVFSLAAFGDGGSAGLIFPLVCCERRCALEDACDETGVCRNRF